MDIWKDVSGFEGLYQVSSAGQIKSLITNKILKGSYFNAYVNVTLSKNKIKHHLNLHRLVAKAFVNNPDNKPYVNHIDGNPSNNHYSNLEFVTPQENSQHHILIISKKPKSSKYIGVCFCKREKKWIAKIRVNGIRKSLGYYDTEEMAFKAYCNFINKHNIKHRYSGAINQSTYMGCR